MSPEVEKARTELIDRMMLTDPGFDVSFDRIVRLLKNLLGTDGAAFTVIEGDRQFLKAYEGFEHREAARDVSFCTHTIEQPGPLFVEDARLDARFAESPFVTEEKFCFYAGLPVRSPSGLPVGALCVLDRKPRTLSPEEAQALVDLRGALEESLVLRSMAVIDSLTGLHNRRYFEDTVEREWRRGFAVQVPLAVVMLDVDFFKKYNDRYGHPAGDACLKAVAAALQHGARRVGDVLARLGGEEFVMVLPHTRRDEALKIAARIQADLAARQIAHADSATGFVTVSIGIAVVDSTDGEHNSLKAALDRADAALYQAKERGRNQAVVAN